MGKYEGTISTVMKHLEKRLKLEFIKVLVCPNMDDEILPFLHHVPYSLTGKESAIILFSVIKVILKRFCLIVLKLEGH